MLALKAFHIIFVVTWFAGLFYLPRLFVYHAMMDIHAEKLAHERFIIMERKLYRGIILPSAILTTLSGLWLGWEWHRLSPLWLQVKIGLVVALWGYQGICGRFCRAFANGSNRKSHMFYRVFNEAPVIVLIGAVFLVVLRPF